MHLLEWRDPEDEKLLNQSYVQMKCRLRKAREDLEEQEHVLNNIKDKIMDVIGAEGFFI